jgi:hypothetical protein
MSVLAEFLKEEAARLRKDQPTRKQYLEDWRHAVGELLDRIEQHVSAADSERVLEFRRGEVQRSERLLGVYTIPYLTVTLDRRAVHFVPLARWIRHVIRPDDKDTQIANTGAVNVTDSDKPEDGPPLFTLYRSTPFKPGEGMRVFEAPGEYQDGEKYVWFVRTPGLDPDAADQVLDQVMLERILVGALR